MERNYKVYVHINKANGKRYYGITCKKNINQRWGNGNGYKFWIDKNGKRHGNEHFWNSICKYGWDNFKHIVIARGLSEDDAKWLEIELIREFDTTNPNKGYNITKGGEGGNGYKHTEEQKQKISETHKGKTLSEEHKQKISEAHKGKTLSEETRKKLSKSSKGKNNGNAKQIYCVELDKYFDTIIEASEFVGCYQSAISEVLIGKYKTAGGYHWLYAEDVNKENINKVMSQEKIILKGKNHPRARQIYCVELDKYFDTITEASEFVGCSKRNISYVLTGKQKTAKGYRFIYAEDVDKLDKKIS